MSDYLHLSDAEKLKLLQAHSFQAPFPTLDQKNWCLHCEQEFDGHSTRVWKDRDGSLWLECGTPGCDGSPIDWAPYPWWDPKHPLTRKHERQIKDKQVRHWNSSGRKAGTRSVAAKDAASRRRGQSRS